MKIFARNRSFLSKMCWTCSMSIHVSGPDGVRANEGPSADRSLLAKAASMDLGGVVEGLVGFVVFLHPHDISQIFLKVADFGRFWWRAVRDFWSFFEVFWAFRRTRLTRRQSWAGRVYRKTSGSTKHEAGSGERRSFCDWCMGGWAM